MGRDGPTHPLHSSRSSQSYLYIHNSWHQRYIQYCTVMQTSCYIQYRTGYVCSGENPLQYSTGPQGFLATTFLVP